MIYLIEGEVVDTYGDYTYRDVWTLSVSDGLAP
jgi:hypothetical protein